MEKLNLPIPEVPIKVVNGKKYILDIIRKKNIVLTPEEWVRQSLLHFLIIHKKYPKSLVKIESGHIYNTLQKRSDILIYDRSLNPLVLIECKAPEVKIDQKVLDQVLIYNQKLNCEILVLTNGIMHFILSNENSQWKNIDYFPDFDEVIQRREEKKNRGRF